MYLVTTLENIYLWLSNSTPRYLLTETFIYIHQETCEECSNSPVYKSLKLGITPSGHQPIYHACSHSGISTAIRRINQDYNNVGKANKQNIEWKKSDLKKKYTVWDFMYVKLKNAKINLFI